MTDSPHLDVATYVFGKHISMEDCCLMGCDLVFRNYCIHLQGGKAIRAGKTNLNDHVLGNINRTVISPSVVSVVLVTEMRANVVGYDTGTHVIFFPSKCQRATGNYSFIIFMSQTFDKRRRYC